MDTITQILDRANLADVPRLEKSIIFQIFCNNASYTTVNEQTFALVFWSERGILISTNPDIQAC